MIQRKVILRFSQDNAEKPVIYKLVKDYDLVVNILRAEINPNKEGYLVLDLSGESQNYEQGIEYLRNTYVTVDYLKQEIFWKEDQCVQCGACTGQCPTSSLSINRATMEVTFNEDKCILCGMCIKVCPAKAVEIKF